MKRSALMPAAWLLDQVAGDPEWLPHPVRMIGFFSTSGETALRRAGQGKLSELASGAALSFAVVAASYYATRRLVRSATHLSPELGDALEVLLAWTCLAARNLEEEAAAVVDAIDSGDLPFARQRLARIVGRDTADLGADEICRALIETLAESASDGILAPLFYMAVGGVPLAMAYKAVNTLDSMIGHADERYFYFGKTAARLDDIANYVPARLTAAAIVAISKIQGDSDALAAWKTWHRDGRLHRSPNAGQPESAMAGALHVRLGGDNRYGGELRPAPHIGREFSPATPAKARSAMLLVSRVALLAVACGVLLSTCLPSRNVDRRLR